MTIDEVTLARLRKEREEALVFGSEAPDKFLSAWVAGVRIIGEGYFTHNPRYAEPANSLNEVSDKWQLIPKWEFVEKSIGVLSGGEAALLAAMCSFYNSEWGDKLLHDLEIRGLGDVSGKLDVKERKILSDLMLYYTGW